MKPNLFSVSILALTVSLAVCADNKNSAAAEPYYPCEIKNDGITNPIGGKIGDVQKGKKLVLALKKGNCTACHRLPIEGVESPGKIGPSLAGVAARYTVPQIRLRVVDEKTINPETIMPGYYRNPKLLHNVKKKFVGKTILTAQEIEDVVSYLATLK